MSTQKVHIWTFLVDILGEASDVVLEFKIICNIPYDKNGSF